MTRRWCITFMAAIALPTAVVGADGTWSVYKTVLPITYEVVFKADVKVTGANVQKFNIFLPVPPETASQVNLAEVVVKVNGEEVPKELLDDGVNQAWKLRIVGTQTVNLEAVYRIGRYKLRKLPFPPREVPVLSDADRERYTSEVLPLINFKNREFQGWLNQKGLRWNPSIETLDSFVERAVGEVTSVKYAISSGGYPTSIESARQTTRDCGDASILLVSILRANFIPCYVKGGWSTRPNGLSEPEPKHGASAIWIPEHGGWTSIDPTPSQKKGLMWLGVEAINFITLGMDFKNPIRVDGEDIKYQPTATFNFAYWSSNNNASRSEVHTSITTRILPMELGEDPVEEPVPAPEPEPTEPAE